MKSHFTSLSRSGYVLPWVTLSLVLRLDNANAFSAMRSTPAIYTWNHTTTAHARRKVWRQERFIAKITLGNTFV